MVTKQPEVTKRTRENLGKAFLELYASKPIERISVREITARAGYNRATFYIYYANVYDLREDVEAGLIDEFHDAVARLGGGESTGSVGFDEFMAHMSEVFTSQMPAMAVFLGPHGDPGFIDRLKLELWPTFHKVFAIDLKDMDDAQRGYAREFYTSGILAVMRRMLGDPGQMTSRQCGEFVTRLIVGAVKR